MNIKSLSITIIFFVACSISAISQNISVSSFKLLDTDLTANTKGTSELDQNGETSALIKIVTTETGFSFDCGMLGIVKTKQTPGEIWVYLPRGAQKITIKHPQLGILRDYYFPISIEGARTYEMFLTTGTVSTIVKQARTTQYVVFNLNPKNSIVELNGELLPTEDGVATKVVKFGTYEYQVRAPDHLSEKGTIEVKDPNKKAIVNITLKPNFSPVSIITDDQSEIWINGEQKGIGKWTGNLGAGLYEFEAKREGYRSTVITKEIFASQDLIKIKIDSPKPVLGEVNINSVPALAELKIDDNIVGETPFISSKILIGKHLIRISKKGYDTFFKNINIEEGKTFELIAQLSKTIEEDEIVNKINETIKNVKSNNTYKTNDGGDFVGETIDGKPNGIGKSVYNDGSTYEGEFKDGSREGYGIQKYKDGGKYIGEWKTDLFDGKGTYYYPNENRFVGNWHRGFMSGHGVLYYFNGDKYDGNFESDSRSGYGEYYYFDGSYYKGNWKNDKKNGQGLYVYDDRASYDGEWNNDIKSGKGIFKYANGDIYVGYWRYDKPEGKGKYLFKNGESYEGNYKRGERSGKGIFKFANGDIYNGDFVKGVKEGNGKYQWKSGNVYEGQWKNDLPNGNGILVDSKGNKFEGYFVNGVPQNN